MMISFDKQCAVGYFYIAKNMSGDVIILLT